MDARILIPGTTKETAHEQQQEKHFAKQRFGHAAAWKGRHRLDRYDADRGHLHADRRHNDRRISRGRLPRGIRAYKPGQHAAGSSGRTSCVRLPGHGRQVRRQEG